MTDAEKTHARLVELGVVFDGDGRGMIDKDIVAPLLNVNDPIDADIMALINEPAFPAKFEVVYVPNA